MSLPVRQIVVLIDIIYDFMKSGVYLQYESKTSGCLVIIPGKGN